MSRIDDALKRLAGVVSPEPRTPSMLDRYASEGKPRLDETLKSTSVEDHKVTSFVAPGPRPVEGRPLAKPVAAPLPVAHPEPAVEIETDAESEPLINVRQLFDYVGFVARSARRHKLLAAGTVALVLMLTATLAAILPKNYHVQTKLLAQRNAVMAALSNPGRAIPWDADAPTRAAAETVLRRDNLISLMRQTDLMAEWERTRPPALKVKDWIVAALSRYTLTDEDKVEAMVGLLEARMVVVAGPVGDGTVTIDLDWPNADMAYKLVQGAQQAFLDARQAAETAAIGESIAILERYSGSLHEDINRTLAELQRTQAASAAAAPVRQVARAPRPAPAPAVALTSPLLDDPLDTNPVLNRMKATITGKRAELARLQEARQRQLADLQARLGQLKTVYTADHPSVLSLQQNIAAVSQDPPQVVALASEVEELQADYDKRLADATDQQIKNAFGQRSAAAPAPRVAARDADPVDRTVDTAPADRPGSQMGEFVKLRLRSELNQLESVLERTDGARIELAVSQAAFKYRYTVIRPAQLPRDPTFPNFKLMMAAGVLGSILLALAVVVAKDLLSKRILEPWQIERQLGLPVLGTLRTA